MAAVPTFAQALYAWLGIRERPFDPQARFVTSYILPPLYLALWRALVALYTFVTLVLVFVFQGTPEFSYFTVLSYWGVWAYHTISAIQTFSFYFALRRWSKSFDEASNNDAEKTKTTEDGHGDEVADFSDRAQSWLSRCFPRPLQFAHSLLFSTICTFPLIVTIVYWIILKDGAYDTTRSTWQNLSVHALNLVFVYLDILFLGREAMRPWSHLLFVIFLIACYVGVAYITYAEQHFYTYDFLNQGEYGTGIVSAFVVVLGIATVVSFLVGQFVIFVREYVAAKLLPSQGHWGTAQVRGVPDEALVPTKLGPGPEGEGGHRHDTEQDGWRQRSSLNSSSGTATPHKRESIGTAFTH